MQLTRWRITDHFRKKQYERKGRRFSREQTMDHSQLEVLADLQGFDLESAWNEEWEKQLFESALAKVRRETNPIRFQMFYMHACKEVPARQVASRLGVKLAEVYFAKYKMGACVKKEILKMQDRML